MATITTPMFGGTKCPQAQLVVTESSSTATTSTLSWTLKWVTHGYTVNSSLSKSYTVKINGSTVKTGSFAIGGKTSQDIASGTVTITKGTSSKSIPLWLSFVMNFTWGSTYGGTKTASGSITVGAKTSYKISYNANGGSGAPSQQTKWHGTNITLSSTKPSRTGYTFKGWATSASGSVAYAAGATYSSNAAVTLYAVWQKITYAVKYNANGGSGAPSQQTKSYGTTLKLSTTKPTKTNYTFKGWAKSATGSVAYAAGANYTANAAITLYAVWELTYTKPVISSLKAVRCNSSGTVLETGTYAKVTFNWSTCTISGNTATVSSIKIAWASSNATPTGSGSSGSVSQVIGGGSLSVEKAYKITVTVTDSKNGSTSKTVTLSGTKFPIDFKAGGSGVAIGKPAETAGVFDVNYKAIFRAGSDANEATANSGNVLIGDPAGLHLALDGNEIMAKSNGTTPGAIYIQGGGGVAAFGGQVKSTYAPASAAESEIHFLAQNATSGTNTGYRAKRTDTGVSMFVGIGGGGTNHGVYSEVISDWLLYNNGTDTVLNAKSNGVVSCGNTLQTSGTLRLSGAYTTGTSVNCRWADGLLHDIVSRGSDGLASYIGPTNFDSSKKTVTNIRGYTVRLYNHGGGTYLGSSGSTAVTSDENLKRDIYDMTDKYEDFFSHLRPVSYKYNAKENVGHRDHLGYIAQEVEDALAASGLTTEQFAGICIENDVTLDFDDDTALTDEEREANKIHYDKLYSLRYEEFIALNTHMIQKAYSIIEEQQTKIDNLEKRISDLESIINNLKEE